MIDKRIIVGAVVLILFVAVFGGFVFQVYANTNTEIYKYPATKPDHEAIIGVAPPELTDEISLVTSWKADGNSVKLGLGGRVKIPNCNSWGYREFTPYKYYYKIYMVTASGEQLLLDRTNYNRDIVHITKPTTGHPGDSMKFGSSYVGDAHNHERYDEEGNKIGTIDEYVAVGACGGYSTYEGGGMNIEILGPYVGKLVVEYWVEFLDTLDPWSAGKVIPKKMLKDEVNLLSGKGQVDIQDEQQVYEEGQTVTFAIETDFSGKTQGGDVEDKGWELRIYDAGGTRKETYAIPDDFRGTRSYEIPAGSYNPSGSNQWKVELWNTLFSQSERHFFTIGEGMSEMKPDTPIITFDKSSYDMGDTALVTIVSQSNIQGHSITEFFVKAYYGTAGVDYVYGPKYVSAINDKVTVSISLPQGDEFLTVEATAFDGKHDQGGIPSELGKNIVYVKDQNPEPDTVTLNVYVRDAETKTPLGGVFVDAGAKTGTTTTEGVLVLYGIPKGGYTIKCSKDGYKTKAINTNLDSDSSITVYMERGSDIDILGIAIAGIIILVFAIIGIALPVGMPYKIIMIILGIVIAILTYFIMSGGI
jgi:hypothetical protein